MPAKVQCQEGHRNCSYHHLKSAVEKVLYPCLYILIYENMSYLHLVQTVICTCLWFYLWICLDQRSQRTVVFAFPQRCNVRRAIGTVLIITWNLLWTKSCPCTSRFALFWYPRTDMYCNRNDRATPKLAQCSWYYCSHKKNAHGTILLWANKYSAFPIIW